MWNHKKSQKIHIQFDKEFFEYGVDTVVSGKIFGWENEESFEVSLVTRYGWERRQYRDIPDEPEHYREMVSEAYIVNRTSGYSFHFPLKYPNIDVWSDVLGGETYTYVYNFIRLNGRYTVVPIAFPELKESREAAQRISDEILATIPNEEDRSQLQSNIYDIKKFFQKKTLKAPTEYGTMRLPWDASDSVDEAYYRRILEQSFLNRLAHSLYHYDISTWAFFLTFCYSLFFLFQVDPVKNTVKPEYLLAEIGLLAWMTIISSIQYRFRSQLSPKKYQLKLKEKSHIEPVLSGGSFPLSDILDDPELVSDNPLLQASGEIELYLQSNFLYSYRENKIIQHHLERLYGVKLLSGTFHSQSDILSRRFQIDGTNPFISKRNELEDLGISLWFDLNIRYTLFPDINYQYNILLHK